MATAGQNIQQEVKQYRSIFLSLVFLTAISVGIHYLHLNIGLSIVLILGVAIIQATLSVCYLMHLISEKRLVFMVLILTVIFVIGLIALIYSGHFSHPEGTNYVS